jgi:hypothetical protein
MRGRTHEDKTHTSGGMRTGYDGMKGETTKPNTTQPSPSETDYISLRKKGNDKKRRLYVF